jgi:hypothetical protein
MASNWDRMLEQQEKLQKQFSNLLPDTTYLDAISKNFAFMDNIVKTHQGLITQALKFDSIYNSPSFIALQQMTTTIADILPKYNEAFLVSSSMFEAFNHTRWTIPEYLNGFPSLNDAILNSTKSFTTEIESLTKIEFPASQIFDSLPASIINPVVSGSAHLHVLKDLDYYDTEIPQEYEDEYSEVIEANCDLAESKILDTNKDWLVLLEGAEYSLVSKNPDKVRHTITSLRELMTQILHHFAPDEIIKKEYTDPSCYHNGRPTRKTRLNYILTQKYGNASLLSLLDADITACMELFNLYQKGTHKIVSNLSEEELVFILKRTKLLIEQLI